MQAGPLIRLDSAELVAGRACSTTAPLSLRFAQPASCSRQTQQPASALRATGFLYRRTRIRLCALCNRLPGLRRNRPPVFYPPDPRPLWYSCGFGVLRVMFSGVSREPVLHEIPLYRWRKEGLLQQGEGKRFVAVPRQERDNPRHRAIAE